MYSGYDQTALNHFNKSSRQILSRKTITQGMPKGKSRAISMFFHFPEIAFEGAVKTI